MAAAAAEEEGLFVDRLIRVVRGICHERRVGLACRQEVGHSPLQG